MSMSTAVSITDVTSPTETSTDLPLLPKTLLNCPNTRWYVFLLASVFCQIGGFLIVAVFRMMDNFAYEIKKRKRKSKLNKDVGGVENDDCNNENALTDNNNQMDLLSEIKDWSGEIISGQNMTGKLLVVIVFSISMGSTVIYLYELSIHPGYTEVCIKWSKSLTQQIDLAFNIIFFVYFFLRLLASNDKLKFWFELYSFVDLYTIPPSFVAIYFDRYWIGLRFLRAVRLMTLTDVLGFLNIIKSNSSIRLCHLVTSFASLVITATGLIQLVEWSGNPPLGDKRQSLSFLDFSYFIIVTISTVGYGDIACHTYAGKALMAFFILGGLAIFANSIPEIFEILGSRNKYQGVLRKERGKQHVVLCGHITYESVSNFLADFLHKDREDVDVKIVILDTFLPSLALRSVLKRYFTQVEFYQGSVMNSHDLARVQLGLADACLILANKYGVDPDAEDACSIMRVISVKNYHPRIRVLVQLMQYHNKAYLMNIPSWDSLSLGDDAVCLAELKSGFLAQSCLAPGFSTLLANLFTMRAFKRDSTLQPWLNNYLQGAGMEMYSEYFSPAFHGLSFVEAVKLAYLRMDLLLIAVETSIGESNQSHGNNSGTSIAINPRSTVHIEPGMQGFFIAQSADESKRAFYFCQRCHGNLTDPQLIKQCQCDDILSFHNTLFTSQQNPKPPTNQPHNLSPGSSSSPSFKTATTTVGQNLTVASPNSAISKSISLRSSSSFSRRGSSTVRLRSSRSNSNNRTSLDLTPYSAGGSTLTGGDPALRATLRRRRMQQQIQAVHTMGRASLGKRIKMANQSERRFDSTGMFHWCPERNLESVILTPHTISSSVFSDHIVVCVFAEPSSALLGLRNFVMPLRASNLHYAELAHIIFLVNEDFIRREWSTIATFPRISVLPGSPLNRANLRAVNVNMSRTCVIMSSKSVNSTDDAYLVDKEAILCSLNLQAMAFDTDDYRSKEFPELIPENEREASKSESSSATRPQPLASTHKSPLGIFRTGAEIQTLTELAMDSNVQFLDPDDEDSPNTEFFMTQPFACGRAFAVSVLDSLVSTAYFNENALTLIRTLTSGGAGPELEQVLAEGTGMQGGYVTMETVARRDRCRIQLLPVNSKPLSTITLSSSNPNQIIQYGKLVTESLEKFGILCIGVYRLIQNNNDNNDNQTELNSQEKQLSIPTTQPDDSSPSQPDTNTTTKDLITNTLKNSFSNNADNNATDTPINSNKRYVVTNPSPYLQLCQTDLIYCLQQFNVYIKTSVSDNSSNITTPTTNNNNPSDDNPVIIDSTDVVIDNQLHQRHQIVEENLNETVIA